MARRLNIFTCKCPAAPNFVQVDATLVVSREGVRPNFCFRQASADLICPLDASALSAIMSVTLVSNPYLDEHSAKLRNKNVPWDVRALGGHLSNRTQLMMS